MTSPPELVRGQAGIGAVRREIVGEGQDRVRDIVIAHGRPRGDRPRPVPDPAVALMFEVFSAVTLIAVVPLTLPAVGDVGIGGIGDLVDGDGRSQRRVARRRDDRTSR